MDLSLAEQVRFLPKFVSPANSQAAAAAAAVARSISVNDSSSCKVCAPFLGIHACIPRNRRLPLRICKPVFFRINVSFRNKHSDNTPRVSVHLYLHLNVHQAPSGPAGFPSFQDLGRTMRYHACMQLDSSLLACLMTRHSFAGCRKRRAPGSRITCFLRMVAYRCKACRRHVC